MPLEKFEGGWKNGLILLEAFKAATILGLMETLEHTPPGRYGHFKGTEMVYNNVNFSLEMSDTDPRHTEGAIVTLYQPLYGEHKYLLRHRPLAMWGEHVEKPEYNYAGPRFRLLKQYPKPIIERP